jgi:hypothetical protein
MVVVARSGPVVLGVVTAVVSGAESPAAVPGDPEHDAASITTMSRARLYMNALSVGGAIE